MTRYSEATVEFLGREIYERDKAAWVATDALRSQGHDLGVAGVTGWIVVPSGDHWLVRFVGTVEGSPRSFFDVVVSGQSPTSVQHYTAGAGLSPRGLSMWTAVRSAEGAGYRRCTPSYNTVVLPDPYSDSWLVYLLAASTEPAIQVGGHHRFHVSPNGKTVQTATALSKGCLVIPFEDKSEMIGFTQMVSDHPLETTTFLSLQHPVPIMFGVPEGSIWVAENGELRRLRSGPAK
jgi:hypothetical protein